MTSQANSILTGALWAMIAVLFFSINDGLIKFLAGDYALHQVVLIRSSVGVSLLLLIVLPITGGWGKIRTARPVMHALRGLCVVWANLFFYMALADMELAEVVGIFFVAPFLISVFSVVFLGEKVGIWRWAAIAIGFAGVMLIVRPGTVSFTLVALLPMLAAAGYAGFHIMTRKLAATESVQSMTFFPPLVFLFVSSSIGLVLGSGDYAGSGFAPLEFLTRAWVWPSPGDFAIMAFIGCGVTIGGFAISQAYRFAEAAVIAPFEYVALIYAAILGYVFFGEWPDLSSWVGLAIVFASGLVMVWREAVNERARVAPPNSPR